ASSHPLEERARLTNTSDVAASASVCCRFSLPSCLYLLPPLRLRKAPRGLTVGTCFGSIENRTFSLQAYMDAFTAGPETRPDRQAPLAKGRHIFFYAQCAYAGRTQRGIKPQPIAARDCDRCP